MNYILCSLLPSVVTYLLLNLLKWHVETNLQMLFLPGCGTYSDDVSVKLSRWMYLQHVQVQYNGGDNSFGPVNNIL